MPERTITTDWERKALYRLIAVQKLPFTVSITKGKRRSVEQNRLGRLWLNEAAEQLGDRTAEELRGECKLMHGVPILRAENDAFREKYDAVFKPLPYELKLQLMQEPFDFPVTRLMSSGQKTRYLDAISRHFAEQGVVLTDPNHYAPAGVTPEPEREPA